MVNENITIPLYSTDSASVGLGWCLSEADGSLITEDDEDEWIQPETINAKIDRLENQLIKLTERIDEILKMFWN